MFATWRCTVCGLSTSRSAMSPSLRPSATSRSTSRSRGLSSSTSAGVSRDGRRRCRGTARPRRGRRPCRRATGRCASPSSTTSSAFGMSAASCSPAREPDRAIASAVHDERGNAHVGERLANVGRERQLEQVRRHLGARRVALERRERRALLAGSARHEGVGEHAAAEAPVLAHELDHRVAGGRRRELGAVRERAVEDDPVDALAVARRVDGGRAAGERAADEAEPARARGGRRARRASRARTRASSSRAARRAIRHPAAEAVVADHLPPCGEALHEAPVRRGSSSPRRRC